jgi:hypothetical protein
MVTNFTQIDSRSSIEQQYVVDDGFPNWRLEFSDPLAPIYDGTDIYSARAREFSGVGAHANQGYNWLINLSDQEVIETLTNNRVPEAALERATNDRYPYLDTYGERDFGNLWAPEMTLAADMLPALIALKSPGDLGGIVISSARVALISNKNSPHILQQKGYFVGLGDVPSSEDEAQVVRSRLVDDLNYRRDRVQYIGESEAGKSILDSTYTLGETGKVAVSLERLAVHTGANNLAAMALASYVKLLVTRAPQNVQTIVGYITDGGAAHRLLAPFKDLGDISTTLPDYPFDVPPVAEAGKVFTMDASYLCNGQLVHTDITRTVLFTIHVPAMQHVIDNMDRFGKESPLNSVGRILTNAPKLMSRVLKVKTIA